MDIKLKNMTKNQKVCVLLVGWLLVGILSTFSGVFYLYYKNIHDYWCIPSYILLIAALVTGGFLICFSVQYVKEYPPREWEHRCKIDNIKTEILIVLLLGLLHKWRTVFWLDGGYIWSKFLLDDIMMILGFSAVMIVLFGGILICIVVLIRQYLLEIMPETSIIWKEIHQREMKLTLEEHLHKVRNTRLIFASIFTCCLFMWIFFSGLQYYINGFLCLCLLVCILFLLVMVYSCCISRKTLHEIACLVEQIDLMSRGEHIKEEIEIPEGSLFYESSQKLKNIDSAMKISVKKQVQAEKMKIDLITNVSHDLKTPLTSMIGYTDLLKKEDLSPEARDYVDVISIKQEKLKEMIQSLFELSKATSGVDVLTMETLDMRKLLEQTIGDMEDAIEESKHEIRTRFVQESLFFKGDNEKMYRVVQNLLENALKYSLDGTRIYLEVRKEGNKIITEIKNISAYEMNFAPEEIMERFIRGDESRSTEGHGLGLAIASSFVRNMDGLMDIQIDGDLFKVILIFPAVES